MLNTLLACFALAAPQTNQAPQIGFVANDGQWDRQALYSLATGNRRTWVSRTALVTQVSDGKKEHVVTHRFLRAHISPIAEDPLPGTINYLLGPEKNHRAGVKHYGKLRSPNLYPGIDLVLNATQEGLRYDFELAPGANPKLIKMKFDGAKVKVNSSGELELSTSLGVVSNRKLHAEQDGKSVPVSFALRKDGSVGFELGSYDPMKPLLIDPLYFSTYLGRDKADYVTAIAYGQNHSVVIGGLTASTTFPTTIGAVQTTYGGGDYDIFVTKLSGDGKTLLYSTFVGGASSDTLTGMVVDASGAVYGGGSTNGDGFPMTPTATYDSTYNGAMDAIAFKLAPDGASLEYSTYLGGPQNDACTAIDLDPATGQMILVGNARSGFPTTASSYDPSYNDNTDGFVTRLSANGKTLVFSTFVGGSELDSFTSVKLGPGNQIYLLGQSYSTDFPVLLPTYDPAPNGQNDVVLVRLSGNGATLNYSSYFGGSGDDLGGSLVVGPGDAVYVTGRTTSADFPTANAYDATYDAMADLFVAKFTPNMVELSYSTYIGGADYETVGPLHVSPLGFATIAGYTQSTDFPTTSSAIDPTHNGLADGFITTLTPSGQDLTYSTFLGTAQSDAIFSVDSKATTRLLAGGWAGGSSFPTTPGVYQGAHDALLDGVALQVELPHLDLRTSIPLRQNSGATRVVGYWTTNYGAITGWKSIGTTSPSYSIGGFGDFDNDGDTDMVQYNPTTRSMGVSLLKNGALSGWATLATYAAGWQPSGVADVNEDGRPDIILYNTSTRSFAGWLTNFNGTKPVISGWLTLGSIPAGWSLVGFKDVNDDGRRDVIVMRTSDRKVGAYLLVHGAIAGWRSMNTIPAGWVIRGFGDMDMDGDEDMIVEQTSTRKLEAYLFDLHYVSGWKNIGSISSAWTMQGTGTLY